MGPRLSIVPAVAVGDARLKSIDFRVLALLGCHTDENGWCFRNQSKMAEQLGVRRESVNRSIAALEKRGYLEKRDINDAAVAAGRRKKALRSICVYRVLLDANKGPTQATVDAHLEALDENNGDNASNKQKTAESPLCATDHNRCDQGVTTVVTGESQHNDSLITNPLDEEANKPKQAYSERQRQGESTNQRQPKIERGAKTGRKKQGELAVGVEDQDKAKQAELSELQRLNAAAVAIFNKHAARCGIPPVQRLTERRAALLNALRCREGDNWLLGFEKLATAQFPTASGWTPASFEIVLREDTYVALIEGQFDPPGTRAKPQAGVVDEGKQWRARMGSYKRFMALPEHQRYNPVTQKYLPWLADEWGPEPGKPGCLVPASILAEFEADVLSLEAKRWRARLRSWDDGGRGVWPGDWGPGIGEPGCAVPVQILEEFSLLGGLVAKESAKSET